jgi:hypothetical protein
MCESEKGDRSSSRQDEITFVEKERNKVGFLLSTQAPAAVQLPSHRHPWIAGNCMLHQWALENETPLQIGLILPEAISRQWV